MICLGAYHSGLVVSDWEYTFAGHPGTHTGVVQQRPKVVNALPGQEVQFFQTIEIGISPLTHAQIISKLDKLKERYPGNTYNLISRNCNHFANDFCREIMGGRGIPGWVNRLSCLGYPF